MNFAYGPTRKQYTIIGLSTGGAMLAAGGLAAGGSLLGGLLGGGGSAPQMVITTPYDQMNGQAKGNFDSTSNNNATYLADMYSQLGTGRNPSYYQSYVNQAQPYQQNLLNQSYFGTAGNRSQGVYGQPTAYGNAMSQAAIMGMNPKAAAGQMGKVNQQWQMGEDALNNYFAGQGYQNLAKTAGELPGYNTGYMNSLSDAFKPTIGNMPGVSASGPDYGAMGSALGGAMGMAGAAGGGSTGMFGGGGQTVQGGYGNMGSSMPSGANWGAGTFNPTF